MAGTKWMVMALAGAAAFSCGKVSDPDAVKLDELKRPQGLSILDEGNGKIKLTWAGTNTESKFDGYNIFGLAVSADTDIDSAGTTFKEGSSIKLLNEDGTANADAKTVVQKFNYNYSSPFASAGTKTSADNAFAYFPRYTATADGTATGDPILPTCKPNSTTHACDDTTKDNQGNSAATDGSMTYEISSLTVGQRYCFFLMSSMSSGKKTSAESSEIACVTPKYETVVQLTTASTYGGTDSSIGIDVEATLRAPCAKGTCTDLTTYKASNFTTATTYSTTSSTLPLYFELTGSSDAIVSITPELGGDSKSAVVSDLGYYANGFSDSTLPRKVPAVGTIDTIKNSGGYNVIGQSIRIPQGNHMYVIAMKGASTDSDYYYHWFWIKDATVVGGTAFNVEFRLSKSVGVTTN